MTCDGDVNSTLSADLDCDQGDLLVVYLQSYDRRMGRTQVKATPLSGGEAEPRAGLVDAGQETFRDGDGGPGAQPRALPHLAPATAAGGRASPPAKLAPCGAGFLGTRACCSTNMLPRG